ncbi:MAG TPA: CvpA family protein [Steroidobacteraceae bacterium]|nr:CvpA family protein [Steroidobacteraceae bacterium]
MGGADHLFAIILLVSGILGVLRGFIRETISLISWLLGLWLAWHFAYLLNPWLGGALAEPGIREWAGRAIVLLMVLLVGAAAGSIAAYYAHRVTGLATTDRLLGSLFGLMRGVVVIGLLVMAGRAVDLDAEAWWQDTKSMPVAATVANWLESYAEPAASDLLERAAEPPGR